MGDVNAMEGELASACVQHSDFDVLSELEQLQPEELFPFGTAAPTSNDADMLMIMERLVSDNLSEFSVVPGAPPTPVDCTMPGFGGNAGAPGSYGNTFLLPQSVLDATMAGHMPENVEDPFDESGVGGHAAPPSTAQEMTKSADAGLHPSALGAEAAATPQDNTAPAAADSAAYSGSRRGKKRMSETEEAAVGEARAGRRGAQYRRLLCRGLPADRRGRRAQVAREVGAAVSAVNREVRALERALGAAGVAFALAPLRPGLNIPRVVARRPGAPSLFVQVPRQYADTRAYLTAGVAYEAEQGPENVANWYMWLADYQRKEMAGVPVSVSMIVEKWFALVQTRCDNAEASS